MGAVLLWRVFRGRRRNRAIEYELVEDDDRLTVELSGYSIAVAETSQACDDFFLQEKVPRPLKIVGLDCEWTSEGEFPVALLQLAFPNRECLLVRLCKISQIPPVLVEIMEDKR